MKRFKTVILKQQQLIDAGLDINAFGMTATKNRPYMVIASNRQMTWLVPLTTQLKRAHGRIQVSNNTARGVMACEAITTDIINIQTALLEQYGIAHGSVGHRDGVAVIEQMQYALGCGRLGVYPN